MKDRQKRVFECAEFLGDYDEMFCRFVEFCSVHIDPTIRTACIQFTPDSGQPIALAFSPDFIDQLDDYSLSFFIAHEICHVYFMHGVRGRNLKKKDKANIAMDIAINHFLIDQLGFDRSRIWNQDSWCWVDTVLNHHVKPKYNFEYYYNLDDSLFKSGFEPIDEHTFMDGEEGDPKSLPDAVQDLMSESGMPGIGNQEGSLNEWVEIKKGRQKKFEEIIRNKIGQISSKKPKLFDTWTKIDRRMCFFGDDLPAVDRVRDLQKPEKFKLVFFVDVSGSCINFLERFINFAASIPEDRFETDFYVFDTKTSKIDLQNGQGNRRVFLGIGGGGTSFCPLVSQVEEMEKEPDLVFVLTDGFAGRVTVKNSKIWHWFLTEGGSKNSITGQGKIYKMSQYQ